MLELLSSNPASAPLVIIFGFVTITALGSTIALQWGKARRAELRFRQAELEASLKQDMLNRGMSVHEIRQVMETSLTGRSARGSDD